MDIDIKHTDNEAEQPTFALPPSRTSLQELPLRAMSAIKPPPLLRSARLVFYVIGAVMTTIIASTYSSLNFAWVCMVNDTRAANNSGYHGDIAWGKTEQQVVFSAYNAGSLSLLILPGFLVDRFGTKRIGLAVLLLQAAATAASPLLVHTSVWALTAARFVVGLCGAFVWPIVFAVLSHWAPQPELGRALLVVATGFPLGQFLNMALSGLECAHLGYPWNFYLVAITSTAFSLFWLLFFRYRASFSSRLYSSPAFLLQRRSERSELDAERGAGVHPVATLPQAKN